MLSIHSPRPNRAGVVQAFILDKLVVEFALENRVIGTIFCQFLCH